MKPPFSLSAIASFLGAEVHGTLATVDTISDLKAADSRSISVYMSRRWRGRAQKTKAGAVIVEVQHATDLPKTCTRLTVKNARTAWAALLRWFDDKECKKPRGLIHSNSVIASDVMLEPTASIGPYCVVGEQSYIGHNVTIAAGCIIGTGVTIGHDSIIGPGVTIHDKSEIGKGCLISAGARIGTIGFGIDSDGLIPHLGHVIIEDHCSVGANTCIDRGAVSATVIGMGSHIDSLVQIGHNVQIGARVRLCGQVGIAGGAIIEDDVWIGGQAGVSGHVTIGRSARIAAKSGVTKSLPGEQSYSGFPAEPNMQRLRQIVEKKRARRQ